MHDDEPRYKPKRRSILITSPFPSPRRSNYPVPQQPDEPIEVSTVSSPHIIQELTARLNTITSTLESAFELSCTLQAQHTSAHSTIASLESKVSSHEALVLERTPPTLPHRHQRLSNVRPSPTCSQTGRKAWKVKGPTSKKNGVKQERD